MEFVGIINRIYAESSWHIIDVYTAHHSYALRYSNEWRGLGHFSSLLVQNLATQRWRDFVRGNSDMTLGSWYLLEYLNNAAA